MSEKPLIRLAQRSDLDALVALEQRCFMTDRLSRRSFSRFVKAEHSQLFVAHSDAGTDTLVGYILVLYRRGTNLARIYSVAVDPQARRQGLSRALMEIAHTSAEAHGANFMRLEVSVLNEPAQALYRALGYHSICRLSGYYADGSDGLRMEKRITGAGRSNHSSPYYAQTTPFTCGPASLMMAQAALLPNYQFERQEELSLWRESTTIYMTSGHGGCSPTGLAVAALRRGLKVELFLSSEEIPFLDSVRDAAKREVIELVHHQFLAELRELGVIPQYQTLSPDELGLALTQGKVAICLISTWRLNRNKAPHWVLATGADSKHIYFSDPDHDEEFWTSEADFVDVPIMRDQYAQLARYGRSRFSATLLLSN
jgi:ribosomal protein S18 acetylase RimI-like enzyme